jgi:hypothetical protein
MQVSEKIVVRGHEAAHLVEAVIQAGSPGCNFRNIVLHGRHGAAQLIEAVLQAGSPGCKFRNILLQRGKGQRS